MTLDISKNEKRIEEMLAEQKKDQLAEQKKDQSVVAQMILDISKNVKRIGEISAEQKKDQSVVAQMTLSISKNEKRIGDISVEQKKDQSDIKPAFAAYFNKDAYGYISLARGQILIFDRVQLNVGGGYNTGTGYFTVPRTGLYLVSCKLRSQANRHLHVFLMKNHNKVALSYGGNYNEGSFTLPVQVDKEIN
ncbi:unnamed protein product [Mytilus edulis]|uniref:C1q domain-containing protein n=1 Tax=Mytilus edulis TaxID=6550 RepID=A0A8S3Q7N8_MYTED|nr:unnamed protein product [Mytilus edulis]